MVSSLNILSAQQSLLEQTNQLISKYNLKEVPNLGLDAIHQGLLSAENELNEARVHLINTDPHNVQTHLEGVANIVNRLGETILPFLKSSSYPGVAELRNNYQQLKALYTEEAEKLKTTMESAAVDLTSSNSEPKASVSANISSLSPNENQSLSLPIEVNDFIKNGHQHIEKNEFPHALGSYTEALQFAETTQSKPIISYVLVQISDWFKAQNQFSSAAKTLSGALALLESDTEIALSRDFEISMSNILNGMATLEDSLIDHLKSKYQLEPKSQSANQLSLAQKNIIRYRQTLGSTHGVIQRKMEEQIDIFDVQIYITETRKQLIGALVADCIATLGPPSCQYALMGLGSLSRSEMCPYSDFEFAILIDESSIKNRNYFNALVELLELKVINLGETPFPLLDKGSKSPTPNGFCFDSGGNTPISKKLIGSVKEIAAFQHIDRYKEDIILTNVLASACLICGKRALFAEYEKTVWSNLETLYDKVPFRQIRAFELLKGHVVQFKPRLDSDKEKSGLFGVKKELYRLPSIALEALALYLKIPEKNSFLRIQTLLSKNLITAKAAENLKFVLTVANRLRIECHQFYKDEKEFLLNPEIKTSQNENKAELLKILTELELEEISKCYLILYPFLDALDSLCRTSSLTEFSTSPFYSDHFDALAEAYLQSGQLSKALDLCQRNLSLHPNKEKGIFEFANVLVERGLYASATDYLSKIVYEKNVSIITARAQNLMGEAYILQKNSLLAYQHFMQALYKLTRLRQAGRYPQIIKNGLYPTILNNLGNMYLAANQIENGRRCFDTAYLITKYESFLTHEKLPEIFGNLGKCHLAEQDFTVAKKYFDYSVKIADEILSPAIQKGMCIENLGLLYYKQKKNSQALSYYEKASTIYIEAGHSAQPKLGECYYKMADCVFNDKHFDKALKYLEKKLDIDKANNENRDTNIMKTLLLMTKIEHAKSKEFKEPVLEKRLQELVSKKTWETITRFGETIFETRASSSVFEKVDSHLTALNYIDSTWISYLDPNRANFSQYVSLPIPYLFMLEKDNYLLVEMKEITAKQNTDYTENCFNYVNGIQNLYQTPAGWEESDQQRIFRDAMYKSFPVYIKKSNFTPEDVIAFTDIAIQTDYRDLYAFLFRAKAKIRQKKFDEAVKDLEEILNLNNKANNAYLLMGICYLHLQNIPRALQEFQECSRLEPEYSYPIHFEAICRWKLGEYQKAYDLFYKLTDIQIPAEELSMVTANLAIAALYCEEIDQAEKLFTLSSEYFNEHEKALDTTMFVTAYGLESKGYYFPFFHLPIVNSIHPDMLKKLDENSREYIAKLCKLSSTYSDVYALVL
jgi:tetratricopeptide (TPR) repeat protein